MKLSKYGVFIKVVECGSFSGAAQQIGYTQSAVSQLISSLEAEMNITLLTRNKYGIHLTADGTACYPYIQAIYNAEAALENKLSDIKQILTGNIRIGAFTSISCHFLPQVIHSFSEKYPAVSFELLQGDYHEIESWILNGKVDFGFLRLPFSPKFDVIPFSQERMVVIMARSHPYADADVFPAEQLSSQRFIMLEEGCIEDFDEYFRRNGITPNVSLRVRDDYTIMSFVEKGIGISILPETVLKRTSYQLAAKPLNPPCYRKIGIACQSRTGLSAAAQLFIREMQGYFSKF